MQPRLFVKICGVLRVEDALEAAELGADAVGVNLVPSSRRRATEAVAREVSEALRGRAWTVAVVADLSQGELHRVLRETGVDRVQLHGSETAELARTLGASAYKALRVRGPEDVGRAADFPEDPILLDAFVSGALGGTGARFDWSLARDLASRRRVLLAGGLVPENVGAAVATVRPWGVDVASGVEVPGQPGIKDWARVSAFIAAARRA